MLLIFDFPLSNDFYRTRSFDEIYGKCVISTGMVYEVNSFVSKLVAILCIIYMLCQYPDVNNMFTKISCMECLAWNNFVLINF